MEAELYAPVKAFLEDRGFEVKGEVGPCDVVAVRGDEAPVVVELKTRLTLALVLQAVDRLALTDRVYLAFRTGRDGSGAWRSQRRRVVALLRRLGLGLLTVSARNDVRAVLEPSAYAPRGSPRRRTRLLAEFEGRTGDPETGGSTTAPRMTAYRQDALRVAAVLAGHDAVAVREVRERAGVARAGEILLRDPYGWFERVRRGHYTLSPLGTAAVTSTGPPGRSAAPGSD
jgi:hypothetical protein